MRNKINYLSIISSWVDKVGEYLFKLCAFFLLMILLIVLYDVFMRYCFSKPTFWALEINEYLFIFISLIPAAEILRQKRHISLDLFVKKMSPVNQRFVETFYLICMLLFCAIVFWRGTEMAANAYRNGMASSTLLSFPLVIPYSLIPAGFGLLGLQLIIQIGKRINCLKQGD